MFAQALPYFVMEALYFPGVPGVFVACVFCGALRWDKLFAGFVSNVIQCILTFKVYMQT